MGLCGSKGKSKTWSGMPKHRRRLNLNSDFFYAALLPDTTSEGYGYVSPSGIED